MLFVVSILLSQVLTHTRARAHTHTLTLTTEYCECMTTAESIIMLKMLSLNRITAYVVCCDVKRNGYELAVECLVSVECSDNTGQQNLTFSLSHELQYVNLTVLFMLNSHMYTEFFYQAGRYRGI